LKLLDMPAATNSSKAKEARSNRAGQAKNSSYGVVLKIRSVQWALLLIGRIFWHKRGSGFYLSRKLEK
jgi:hypothetical protein